MTGILLSSGCVDLYNPKVIRSTMGSIYRMPFFVADDFHAAIRELKGHGVRWYAAHLKGEDSYDRQDYRQPTGFLIGNESRGLSDETAELGGLLYPDSDVRKGGIAERSSGFCDTDV